jgi:hypothetical protein
MYDSVVVSMRSKRLMLGQVCKAFLRAAADGFEPARGRGFALPHVTLGGRAGRSNNGAKCTREAGNAVAVAHLAAARVPQSSAVGTEDPRFSRGSFTATRTTAWSMTRCNAAAYPGLQLRRASALSLNRHQHAADRHRARGDHAPGMEDIQGGADDSLFSPVERSCS